jgi:1-deoxy-D-xylulose-5-phosphate synthase
MMAPRDIAEMRAMSRFAIAYQDGPIALRYPRGGGDPLLPSVPPIELGRAEVLSALGNDVALIGYGEGVRMAVDAAVQLAAREIHATIINARFCKPLDSETILEAARRCNQVVTIEDGIASGGFGSAVLELLSDNGIATPVHRFGLPDKFIEHGPIPTLRALVGLTAEDVAARVLEHAYPAVDQVLSAYTPADPGGLQPIPRFTAG